MNVRSWIEERRSQLAEDVAALVEIKSVSQPEEGGFPFGTGCSKVLEKTLSMAERYGLKTENCQSYCGTAWLEGTEVGELGIFSHLDVVPEGEGWTVTSPYRPIVLDGWLYGRGSADNKGACVAAMYALRYLKENGILLRHTVRQYYGCDEERGMEDITYYLEHHKAPEFAVVPDAAFPVCYGEKGRYHVVMSTGFSDRVSEFRAGEGVNSVPSHARIVCRAMPGMQLPEAEGIGFSMSDESLVIEASGLAAHAAKPAEGRSALYLLMEYLMMTEVLETEETERLRFLYRICSDYTGASIGISCQDEDSGALTVTASLLEFDGGNVKLHLDIRYPATKEGGWILEKLNVQAVTSGWQMVKAEHSPAFYFDKHSREVQCLTDISNRYQKKNLSPYCMSGGTYARKLSNAVGYGPGTAGQKKPGAAGHGYGHQPDECVCIDNLVQAVEIYAEAIMTLDNLL